MEIDRSYIYIVPEKRSVDISLVDKSFIYEKPGSFSLAPFLGKKVLRGSINTYRIHIWNFFMPDMRLENRQQELIESGELKPKITPDGDSTLCEKVEFIKQYVSKVVFTNASRFYLVCFLNTPDSEILGKVVEYLKEMGIKIKFELANKDEIRS